MICAPSAEAATYLSGFEEQTIASGLTRPMTVAWGPDGRMFVAEKDGVLKVIPAGGGPATAMPGGARWLARLGAPLPVGRYRLLVRSVDKLGNRSELGSGPSTRIRRTR